MSVLEWKTLGALREWRDQLAAKQKRPPYAVFPNNILIDLARRRPTSKRGLHANRRIHSSFIRHHGMDVLHQISLVTAETIVPRPLTVAQRQVASALALWAEAVSERDSVAPRLLMPAALRAAIARDGVEQMGGWRAPWVPAVKKFLGGEVGLMLNKITGKLMIGDAHQER
jgi:ribonuclease D